SGRTVRTVRPAQPAPLRLWGGLCFLAAPAAPRVLAPLVPAVRTRHSRLRRIASSTDSRDGPKPLGASLDSAPPLGTLGSKSARRRGTRPSVGDTPRGPVALGVLLQRSVGEPDGNFAGSPGIRQRMGGRDR